MEFLHKFQKTREHIFLSKLELRGQVIYDIGGYHGIFTIFLSKQTGDKGKVIVFEPNAFNMEIIKEHVLLNKVNNVEFQNIGIGGQKEVLTLFYIRNRTGTGTMLQDIGISIRKEVGSTSSQVMVDMLDASIAERNLQKPDFIKIDIEGMEYLALQGMKKTILEYHPKLYIEIHGSSIERKSENITNIYNLLKQYKYTIYHIESGQFITNDNIMSAKSGHLYCQFKFWGGILDLKE